MTPPIDDPSKSMPSKAQPSILVIGSVNLDIVANTAHLPEPGETVSDASLAKHPGGKGANQALAASRLGARVTLSASVGDDAEADQALALLQQQGVDLSHCVRIPGAATGVALICVEQAGENQIVVAPGANALHSLPELDWSAFDAVICQLEISVDVISAVVERFKGFLCVNLAPAREVPDRVLERADLIVVNETEARFVGSRLELCRGWVAITQGKRDAVLARESATGKKENYRTTPPQVSAVDATGAGDAFTAALTLALLEDLEPGAALKFACATGACAATRAGAQPSLPVRTAVESLLPEN